jgi:hypothetical protein
MTASSQAFEIKTNSPRLDPRQVWGFLGANLLEFRRPQMLASAGNGRKSFWLGINCYDRATINPGKPWLKPIDGIKARDQRLFGPRAGKQPNGRPPFTSP